MSDDIRIEWHYPDPPDLAAEVARLRAEVEQLTRWRESDATVMQKNRERAEKAEAEVERLRVALLGILAVIDSPELGGAGYASYLPGEAKAIRVARAALEGKP